MVETITVFINLLRAENFSPRGLEARLKSNNFPTSQIDNKAFHVSRCICSEVFQETAV